MAKMKPSELDQRALDAAVAAAEAFAGPLPTTTISRAIVAYLNAHIGSSEAPAENQPYGQL